MSNPQVSAQDLIDSLRIRLGNLSNAFTTDQYISFLNDGVQEVWSVIRSLDLDYFADFSQDTTQANDDYFVDLTSGIREYVLPRNCREVRFIESLTPGFMELKFEYHPVNDPVFTIARKAASSQGPASPGVNYDVYHFTIFGNQLILAEYPETTLQVKIWFIKAIDDIATPEDILTDILHPFNKKIVDFSAEKMMLSAQNESLAQAWMLSWKEGVKMIALTAGERVSTDPIFIYDFLG